MDTNTSEVRQLESALEKQSAKVDERFSKIDEQLTKINERFANIEEQLKKGEELRQQVLEKRDTEAEKSLQQKLSFLMPKVEELLAFHQRASSSASSQGKFPPAQPSSAPITSSTILTSLNKPLPASTNATSMLPKLPRVQDVDGSPARSIRGAPAFSSNSTDAPKSLLEAAGKGDVAALRRFLAGGGKVNARDKHGNSALHLAASNGRTEVADVLIANGAGVDFWSNWRRTPLHCAAANGHAATVARLVAAGAAVNAQDTQGATAIALAARGGHAAVVEFLLEKGAAADGETALLNSIEHGSSEFGTFLREKGANVNAADVYVQTPLLVAVKNQKRDIVQLLLRKGASPAKRNFKSESPLFVASRDGHEDILEDLLKAVQQSEVAEIGFSLRVAANAGVVWMLADAARDVVSWPAGKEALLAAAADGRQEALHALLQLGVDANATDVYGTTALHKAAIGGHASCVRTLLAAGANVDVVDKNHQTPLCVAAGNGKRESVVALMEGGATDQPIFFYPSAVYLARRNNHELCALEIERRMPRRRK